MKINGKTLNAAIVETIVIPRPDGDIVFRCAPVIDYSEFDALCPKPVPPKIKPAKGEVYDDVNDANFKVQIADYSNKKTNYLFIKSLAATEGLEWTKVNMSNPDTWGSFMDELRESGFSELHIGMIINKCIEACGLDSKKIEEATKRFLAGPVAVPEGQ